MTEGLNHDFSRKVVMHTYAMTWQASPSRGVWRKRLDLVGEAEECRVTSVVRYDPGSRFSSHPHPDGEEILVLEGVFSDESGDYPAGSFLLNPEGFCHAPFSKAGCTIFVKLRQYPGKDRRHVVINSTTASWEPTESPGVDVMRLYEEFDYPESAALYRLASECEIPRRTYFGGLEIFVLEGSLFDGETPYDAGDWVRFPAGSTLYLSSERGARFYQKSGHLV